MIMNFDESIESVLPPGDVPLDFDDTDGTGGNTSELINSARNLVRNLVTGAGDFQEEKSKPQSVTSLKHSIISAKVKTTELLNSRKSLCSLIS